MVKDSQSGRFSSQINPVRTVARGVAPRSALHTMTKNYNRTDMAWICEDFIRDHGLWDTWLDWMDERKAQEAKALECTLRGPDVT